MSAVGDYVIQQEIGSGSMARIHMAYKKSTGARCCVKVIDKRTIEDAQDMRHLHNEVRLLSELDHPNIVKYIDFYDDKTNFYIFQEFLEGRSLLEMINETNGLSEEICHQLFIQLVSVLSYMHERSVYHRDIKPDNLMFDGDGNMKLIDFGFSKEISINPERGTACGSPAFVAPEVIKREEYSYAADIWSVGIILYLMATGQLPFRDSNVVTLLTMVVENDLEFPPGIDSELKELLIGMLEKDPSRRLSIKEIKATSWYTKQEFGPQQARPDRQQPILPSMTVNCMPRLLPRGNFNTIAHSSSIRQLVTGRLGLSDVLGRRRRSICLVASSKAPGK